jgi:hypothetical protein
MARLVFALILLLAPVLNATVTRVEVTERADLPLAGYERIAGKLHFALYPKLPANRIIVDLDLAPKNAQGQVEFSSDFMVLRAKDAAKRNGTALLEIVNRGRGLMWTAINTGAGSPLRSAQDFGDNFLLQQGFTLIWVGWQFDVNEAPNSFKVYAPVVRNVTGPVRIEILTNQKSFRIAHRSRFAVRAARYHSSHAVALQRGPLARRLSRGVRAGPHLRIRIYRQGSGGRRSRAGRRARLHLLHQAAWSRSAGRRPASLRIRYFAERTSPAHLSSRRIQRR